ncbi:C39 family peptidase [Ammoniphilus sp. 3BR4]|uniref:C39 family peptidase n=1 Tax=Ammoniphilus sp. 3BR4 TaxID=3158265 RepID=UPI003467C839
MKWFMIAAAAIILLSGGPSDVQAAATYDVYQGEKLIKRFESKLSAIVYARKWDHSSVRRDGNWVWNNYPFEVYQYDKKLKEFPSHQQALKYARKWDHASIRKMPGDRWLWDNYPYQVYLPSQSKKSFPDAAQAIAFAKAHSGSYIKREGRNYPVFHTGNQFQVYQNSKLLKEFSSLSTAIPYANKWENSRVVRTWDQQEVWRWAAARKGFALLDAPLIKQNPELPRGCEVTSLAMMLHHAGKATSKMLLAEQVIKDRTPIKKKHGKIVSWGDPYLGFVGDMYNWNNPGFGVYHEPLLVLANHHLEGKALDLTGSDFNDVLEFLEKGHPVVAIINSRFRPVYDWIQWKGPQGKVRVTFREHAVLLVGYDQRFVYVNDPLSGQKNRKLGRYSFEKGWEQMGRQAITY